MLFLLYVLLSISLVIELQHNAFGFDTSTMETQSSQTGWPMEKNYFLDIMPDLEPANPSLWSITGTHAFFSILDF